MIIEIHNILDTVRFIDGAEAVIFDLDDTLYPEIAYVKSGFKKIAGLFPDCPDLYGDLLSAYKAKLPAFDTALEKNGLINFKKQAIEIYRYQIPDIELYPGVADMLKDLSAYHKIGIITDGRPEAQNAKLEKLGLKIYPYIITDELGGVGFRKPNETAYLKMCDMLSVPLQKAVYVGDNIVKDFISPEKLGMKSIHFINPEGIYYGLQK